MGDTVLDPFIGSGTTAVAALMLNRHYVGIDTNEDFVKLSEERLHNKQVQLLESEAEYSIGADPIDRKGT